MFSRHKRLFMSFFAMSVILGFFMLFQNMVEPSIAIGKTYTSQEQPTAWKAIMADNINSKGINLVVDGKKVVSSKAVIMSDDMYVLFPSQIIANTLNCAYNEYEDGTILIQKGDNKAELELDSDYILVDGTGIELANSCIKDGDDMYIRANVFAKSFGYEYKWDINENTLYLTDVNYIDNWLPARYSYVDIKRVPQVTNQGDLSICWATSSIAAVETVIMPKHNYFLSANHMAMSNGNAATINIGGDYTRAIAYLAAWLGPVSVDDAYNHSQINKDAEVIRHLQEAQILEAKNYEAIKRAVFLYGGVQSYMYTSMVSAYGGSPYYNKEKSAYCYIGTQKANHAIVIIGWDDNYPKENFNMELEGDGAFICMNSWGSQFGENGIFYVSYYDSNIGKNNVVYTAVESVDNYDNIYQSDLCGWVGQLGYENESAFFANVYTAKENETLEAVAFYATGRNTEYEIYLVDGFTSMYSLRNRQLLQKGKVANSGYYTITLNDKKYLEKDKKYAIVVRIKTPGSQHPIAVELRSKLGTQDAVIDDGEGYISLSGTSWEHVEDSKNCNVCLKMFTNNVNK